MLAFIAVGLASAAAPAAGPERCPEVALPDALTRPLSEVEAAVAKDAPRLFFALGPTRQQLLRRLLAQGDNPNVCVAGASILAWAAGGGDVESVRQLLDAGARPNRPRAPDGTTALMQALSMGRFDVARLLLDRGADPLLGSDHGFTPLFNLVVAAQVGASHQSTVLALAELLLRRGVPVNAQVQNAGSTALMFAALKGHQPLVELLLSHGALVSLANRRGETALTMAERHGHAEVVKLLKAADERTR